jgi:hypothetical protein
LEILCIDVNESMKKIIDNDENSKKILILLSAVYQADTFNCENKNAL